jgi:hypothetical protein
LSFDILSFDILSFDISDFDQKNVGPFFFLNVQLRCHQTDGRANAPRGAPLCPALFEQTSYLEITFAIKICQHGLDPG